MQFDATDSPRLAQIFLRSYLTARQAAKSAIQMAQLCSLLRISKSLSNSVRWQPIFWRKNISVRPAFRQR